MSASSKIRNRGFTLAEMLTVMVILGIFTTFVVVIVAPVVSAPSKEQAKIDTLQAAAQGLYQVQRDLRMSDTSGVYACTNTGGAVTCSQPSSSQGTSILAIVTPLANGQLTWDLTLGPTLGLPTWQGVLVYWLVPNNSGSNDLEKAYVGTSVLGLLGSGPLLSFSSEAAKAVQSAQAAGGTPIAHSVNAISMFINTNTRVVGLNLTAQSREGNAVNSTTYSSNTFTRN